MTRPYSIHPKKSAQKLTMTRYAINSAQMLSVVALNGKAPTTLAIKGEGQWQYLNHFERLSWPIRNQLEEQLKCDGWDFDKYANPPIYVLQKLTERMVSDFIDSLLKDI